MGAGIKATFAELLSSFSANARWASKEKREGEPAQAQRRQGQAPCPTTAQAAPQEARAHTDSLGAKAQVWGVRKEVMRAM
jgi:hypothetical protein